MWYTRDTFAHSLHRFLCFCVSSSFFVTRPSFAICLFTSFETKFQYSTAMQFIAFKFLLIVYLRINGNSSITFYQILKENTQLMFSFCNRAFTWFTFHPYNFLLFTLQDIFRSLSSSFFISCDFLSQFSDAPVCASAHEELLGALKHETLSLKCEVDASPPADSFHWTFNSSGEPTDLSAKLQSSEVCYDSVFFFNKKKHTYVIWKNGSSEIS